MTSLNNTKIEIFTTSKLKQLEINKPEIQRIAEDQKVKEIVQFQLDFHKTHNYFNFTASGPINIHKWNDQYLLVDGQHRLAALECLHRHYSHNIEFYVIFVEVKSQEELEFNYNMINKNTPLPDFTKFQSINKNIPEEVAHRFQSEWPDIWSKNSQARRPHMYFNYFQESLAFICQETGSTSATKLHDIVIAFNTKVRNWNETSFKVTDNVYQKARTTGLYLGLFKHQPEDYGYDWARHIVEEQTGKTIKKSTTSNNRKKKIPKKVKDDSWDTYIGKEIAVAPCLCCRTTNIGAKDFIAGHIISEFNGGLITVDNIVPICSACNLSMGSKNMELWIKEYYPNNYNKFSKRDYTEGITLFKVF